MSISCSTCLECFYPSSEVSSKPCGHLFHTVCIKRWFQNDQHNCPQCRNSFQLKEIHRIYFSEAQIGEEENESAQSLLEKVFDIALTSDNADIVQVLKDSICRKCKKPVGLSDKCLTQGHVYHSKCQPYFIIKNPMTNMVLTVESNLINRGAYDEYPCYILPLVEESSKQLWFWDRDIDGDFYIRSKAYPTKILDLNRTDFHHKGIFWKAGNVSLYHSAHQYSNQKWKIIDGEIVCKYENLRLAISEDNQYPVKSTNGYNVGCFEKNGGLNQKWEIMVLDQNQIQDQ